MDFTPGASELVRDAGERARSLGHDWVGGEHLLLALAAHDGPVGEVIRGHGVTVPRIERCIPATVGRGRGEGLFDSLDRAALASVGIDLDTVRDAVERSFGPTSFRPLPARPRRRFLPRALVRFARRRHSVQIRNAEDATAGGILIDVDHLAFRLATMHRGAVHDIFEALGVSEARLADDLLHGMRRVG